MAKQALSAWSDEDKRLTASKTADDLERKQTLDDEFEAGGGVTSGMKSFATMSLAERDAYYLKEKSYANNLPKPDPDLDLHLFLSGLDDETLNNRWSDVRTRENDIELLGGRSSDWAKEHIGSVRALAGKGKKEKTPEQQLLDGDLNSMKRDIELYFADSGRTFSDEGKKIFINRALNDYEHQLQDYMVSKGLEKVTQVPVEQRTRMKAKSLVTYQVQTPGMVYGTNIINLTTAEARAQGLTVGDAGIVAASLPVDLRMNHTDGATVREIPQANGDPILADVGVPLSGAPANVQAAYRTVGESPVIIRDLVSGGYLVIGFDRAYPFRSDGTPQMGGDGNPVVIEKKGADILRNTIPMPQHAPSYAENPNMWAEGHGIIQ